MAAPWVNTTSFAPVPELTPQFDTGGGGLWSGLVNQWAEILLVAAWGAAAATGPVDKVAATSVAVCASWAVAEQWLTLALVGLTMSPSLSARGGDRAPAAVTALAAAAAVALEHPLFGMATAAGAVLMVARALPRGDMDMGGMLTAAAAVAPATLAFCWHPLVDLIFWLVAATVGVVAAAATQERDFTLRFTVAGFLWDLGYNVGCLIGVIGVLILIERRWPTYADGVQRVIREVAAVSALRVLRATPSAHAVVLLLCFERRRHVKTELRRMVNSMVGITFIVGELACGTMGTGEVVAVLPFVCLCQRDCCHRLMRSRRISDGGLVDLYHATNRTAAARIRSEGFCCGATGYAGGGIYFATTPQGATARSRNGGDVVLRCSVRLGSVKCVPAQDVSITYGSLLRSGHDSVMISAYNAQVFVVYNPDQVVRIHG